MDIKKEILKHRIIELFDDFKAKELKQLIDKVIESGAINIEDYNIDSGGWYLPKIILCAIIESKMAWNFKLPNDLKFSRDLNKIKKHL